jgi:ligand-binding sensor protein
MSIKFPLKLIYKILLVASTGLTNLSYLIVVSAQFIVLYLCGILLYSQVILYNIWIKVLLSDDVVDLYYGSNPNVNLQNFSSNSTLVK